MIETKQKSKLPAGWRWVRLDDVVDLFPGAWGQDAAFDSSMAVRVVGTSHISNEGMLDPSDAPTRFLSKNETDAVCFEGDLLVVKSSGSAANIRSGKTAICSAELAGHIACSNFLMRLVPRPRDAESYLLWRYLNSEYTKAFVRRIAGSSTYPNIKWSTFRGFEIPLPPLPEQKRIAGILIRQMAAVDKAKKACQEKLAAAEKLPASYLNAIFNSDKAKQWPILKVNDICKKIEYGYTTSANAQIDSPKFLRITDIQNGRVCWKSVPGCDISDENQKKYLLNDKDIVFARTGATTGKSFLVHRPPVAVYASYLIRLTADKNKVIPEFLYNYFQSAQYWTQINASARGGAQPNVNASLLGKLKTPLPPLPEQKRIAGILTEQMVAAQKVTKTIEEELELISKLPASLLQRAFTGKL